MASIIDKLYERLSQYTPIDVKIAYQEVKKANAQYLPFSTLVTLTEQRVNALLNRRLEAVKLPPKRKARTFEQKLEDCKKRKGITTEDYLVYLRKICPNSSEEKILDISAKRGYTLEVPQK